MRRTSKVSQAARTDVRQSSVVQRMIRESGWDIGLVEDVADGMNSDR